MRRRLVLLLLLCCAAPAWAQGVPISVQVQRVDDRFEIQASLQVGATPTTVWRILSDYERLPEFVPDLRRTRILQRSGNTIRLEQFGTASWLFFARDIHLRVDVTETPIANIDVRLVDGDMRLYEARWEFDLGPEGGTRIRYSGKLAPKFALPGFLGNTIIRSDIQRMLRAVQQRLETEY